MAKKFIMEVDQKNWEFIQSGLLYIDEGTFIHCKFGFLDTLILPGLPAAATVHY